MQFAVRVHEDKGLNVADEGEKTQTAAVNVGGQRAAEAHTVYPRLLFANGPGFRVSCLRVMEIVDNLRPFDTRLGFKTAAFLIEAPHALELLHVQQNRIAAKLAGRPSSAYRRQC